MAQWAVVTDDDDVVQAIRDDTPAGDPEHTQTLANLTSRITTAAANDDFATSRVTTVAGLQQKYRDMGAYGDITPGDGQTTTFTPAQPSAAPTCTNGTVFANPADNRELVKDCEALLAAKDTPAGHGGAELGHRHGDEQLDGGQHRRHAHAGDGAEPAQHVAQRDHPVRDRAPVRADDPEPQDQQPDRGHTFRIGPGWTASRSCASPATPSPAANRPREAPVTSLAQISAH